MTRPIKLCCVRSNYGKCSKITNSFLVLFSNKTSVINAGIHKMLVSIANREDPGSDCFFRSSLIWVFSVCLGLFGTQPMFEISRQFTVHVYADLDISRQDIRNFEIFF